MRSTLIFFLCLPVFLQAQTAIAALLDSAEHWKFTQPEQSISYTDSVLRLLPCQAKALQIAATAYLVLGKTSQADAAAKRGLDCLADQPADPLLEGKLYGTRGSAAFYAGQLDTAMVYYQQSLRPLRLSGDSAALYKTLSNLSIIWLNADQADKLLAAYPDLHRYYASVEDTTGLLSIMINKSSALSNLGIADSAYWLLEEIAPFAHHLPALTQSNFWLNYAIRTEERGDYAEAIPYYDSAATFANQLGNRRMQQSIAINQGITYHKLGNTQQAVQMIEAAVENISQDTAYKDLLVNAYQHLHPIYQARNEWEKAFFAFRQFVLLRDEIYSEQKQVEYEEIQAKYDKSELERDVLEQQIALSKRETLLKGAALLLCSLLGLISLLFFLFQERKRRLSLSEQNAAILKERNEELLQMNQELENSLKEGKSNDWKQEIIRLNNQERSILLMGSIISIQSKAGGVCYYTREGDVFNWQALKDSMRLLHADYFLQISRSCVVNRECVRGRSGKELILENGNKVVVGNTFQEVFNDLFPPSA